MFLQRLQIYTEVPPTSEMLDIVVRIMAEVLSILGIAIHPSAHIVYYDTDSTGQSVVSHTEPLLPSSIKAYWGEVVPAHASDQRMRADAARAPHRASDVLGWARITVHDQGDERTGHLPVFEGAFSVRGITHHVATRNVPSHFSDFSGRSSRLRVCEPLRFASQCITSDPDHMEHCECFVQSMRKSGIFLSRTNRN
jgi:hypothetical protein